MRGRLVGWGLNPKGTRVLATGSRERPRRALSPVSWPHHGPLGDETEWLAETQWAWIHPSARRGPGMGECDAGFGSEPSGGLVAGRGWAWGGAWACWPGSFAGDLESSGEGASEQHVLPTSIPSSLLCPAPLPLFRKAYWGPKWGGTSAPSTDL